MRQGTSNRRPRSRGNGGNGGNNNNQRRGNSPRTKVYDSNGPDVRIRGTAHQVAEKYMTLSKDASSMGELILAESYLQHAEHYQRIINLAAESAPNTQQNTHNSNHSNPPVKEKKQEKPADVRDDLSLPTSILGGEVEVKSKDVVPSSTVNKKAPEAADMVE